MQLASPAGSRSSGTQTRSQTGPTATPTQTAEEDIHGLRPPYHLANPWLWAAYAGGALAALALGYGSWRWLRRPATIPQLSLEEATLRKLDEARRLMQPEKARDFSIAISEIVRGYVEQRFAVSASHLTTWEFLHYLTARADTPLASYRHLLGQFLFHCDAAKYARWVLSAPEMEVMFQDARHFVEETGRPTVAAADTTIAAASESPGGVADLGPTGGSGLSDTKEAVPPAQATASAR